MPTNLLVGSGQTHTVSSGDTERYLSTDVSGTLAVNGTLQLGGLRIGGLTARPSRGELTVTPRALSVGFPVRGQADVAAWRDYQRAGDIAVQTAFSGQFRAIDRAGRSGPVTVQAPPWADPPLDDFDGWVQSYTDEQVAADVWQVDMTIARETNRGEPFPTVSQSDDWNIITERGTLGLAAEHVGHTSLSGRTTAGHWELTLALDGDQAAAWADACSHPDGVSDESVPDGTDCVVDDSPNSRQDITIVAPLSAPFPEGDYLVRDWTLEPLAYGDAQWVLSATVWQRQSALIVRSGESYTIPSGTTETYGRRRVDGTLTVDGTLILTGENC